MGNNADQEERSDPAASTDITELKGAEEALRESDERLRSVLDASRDAIYKLDLGTRRFDYLSPAVHELSGFTPEEVVGRMHPEDRQRFETYTDNLPSRMGEAGAFSTIDYRCQRKGGEYRWQSNSWVFLHDEDGQPVAMVGSVRDITERKQAEEALREAKEFAEGLIASMQDGFSVLDSSGVHVDVNAAFCQMTGFSREELIGVGPPHPYWPPEAYEEIDGAFQKTLGGQFADFELTFMRKNGERFPVIVSPSWLKDKEGNVISYFATVKDITERKRAEEALRESEERLRGVLEVSRDLAYKLNLETGTYDYVSPSVFQLTGFTPEEFIAMGFERVQERVHPEDLPGHRAHLERMLSQADEAEPSPTIQYRWKCKDSEYRWFSDNRVLIRDKDGRLIARVGTSRDITELKQAEEALQRAREELESKVERQMERGNPYGLTFRELTVLHLVAAGRADKEIGFELGISPMTVHKHITNILHKMGAASRTEASVRAVREGLLD